MANETEYSNYHNIEEQISVEVIPAFVAQSVVRPFVMVDQVKNGAKTVEFTKLGTISASTPGEGIAPSKSEYTETNVPVTVAEATSWTEQTVFSQVVVGSKSAERLIQVHASSLARHFDASILALAASITATAGSTGVALDEDAIIQAIYLIESANAIGNMAAVVSPKGAQQLRTAFNANAAVSFNSIAQNGLENGNYNAASYAGSILGIPFYKSTLVYNDATDDYGTLFTPFGIGVAEANGGEAIYLEQTDASRRITGRSLTYVYGTAIVTQGALVRLRHVD
jgi:hypothetical protein